MLLITLENSVVDKLFQEVEATEGYQLIIDLAKQAVITPSGENIPFEIDSLKKHCLLNGLDEIGQTLQQAEVIKTYEIRRQQEALWLFLGV